MDDSLRKLQEIEIGVLERFKKLCEENDITYYIIGGTLIGAMRHGGFIPWDDDIDIAMPRKDYCKLIDVMHESDDEVLGMEYYRDDESLYFYPVKITDKRYRIKEPRYKTGTAHPWIDILPLDGWPEGKISGRVFKLKMLYYRFLLGLHYSDNLRNVKRSGMQKAIITFARITHIGRLINPTKVKNKIDKTLSAQTIDDCRVVGTCMGAYFFHEFVPRRYFGKGSKVIFEGIEVNAPEKIVPYLTHMYGDYMKLPPKEKQVAAHNVEFVEVEE